MKKVSIISAEEAALKVQDGDTIATGGFVSCACPETLSKALEKRFLETGHPNNLTLFFAAGQGHRDGTGGDLYPILTRQKNAGLLTYRWEESPQGPPRKYYSLTDKGRELSLIHI